MLAGFAHASPFCYVVSACKKYVPELCAELNSLDIIGNKNDVHVIGYQLPDEFVAQFRKVGYQVILHPVTEPEAREFGGESEPLCRGRYNYAAVIGREYAATCVLDADMCFVRPVEQFFQIAADAQMIVGATLEQKRMYGDNEHHSLRNADGSYSRILPDGIWNPRDICCAPIFVDMKTFGSTFSKSWEWFKMGFRAPDMEAINLAIMVDGLTPDVLLIPNVQWVGTNEKLLKPYIRAISHEKDPEPGGKLWTETGDPLYLIHGQFYKARWRQQQLLNRKGCIDGYIGGSQKCENMAAGALEGLYRYFRRCLDHKITVPKIPYTQTGHPEDPEYGVGGV